MFQSISFVTTVHLALLYIRHRQVIHTSSSHFKPLNNREPQGILYTGPTSWPALVERHNQATEGPQSGRQTDVAVQAARQMGLSWWFWMLRPAFTHHSPTESSWHENCQDCSLDWEHGGLHAGM